jgi:hypothetical protein
LQGLSRARPVLCYWATSPVLAWCFYDTFFMNLK